MEDSVDLAAVCRSLSSYRCFLEGIAGYYCALEPELDRVGAWDSIGLPKEVRRKSRLLAADLMAMNGSPRDRGFVLLPSLGTPARAVGCLYVVEGSTLGGLIIKRSVIRLLGANTPCTFFSGYAKQTAPMWREFGEAVGRFAVRASVSDEIVIGARETFASMLPWFGKPETMF